MPELNATVRLQLHAGFDMHAAAAQVPYYHQLGISHVYLSPIARARPGSTHGYDAIDPTTICPERGGEAGLQALSSALRQHGMGAILDIVPNHMAADASNPWWRDVLRHGRDSRYARYFDIDWASPASPGRVWLPWLNAPLDSVIAQDELRIEWTAKGEAALVHEDWALPLANGSVERDGPLDVHTLRRILDRQHYRLAWWRSAADVINYRRFFDIDGLVALDMRGDEVFDAVHALPLRLLADGIVDGLRVDHVDGLADPGAYLRRLREAMERAAQARTDGIVPSLHVEKILRRDERLPADWPVDGSTGYEMMDRIGAVMHDAHAARLLGSTWQRLSGRSSSFALEERLARHQWLRRGLCADFARCLRALRACLDAAPEQGDYTDAALERACADVLAEMPVYRTYITGDAPTEHDARLLTQAFEAAEHYGHPDDAPLRGWLRRLLEQPASAANEAGSADVRWARRRFEQLCAPLAAKATEDTAFYRFGMWLSRNEVGSDPAQFSLDVASFHRDMQCRASHSLRALSATATHDHKRGEDVRARLAALSEDPERWTSALASWLPRLGEHAPQLAPADLAMLLQTVVGAWPLDMSADEADTANFVERLQQWWIKALREARLRTHWTQPNSDYEDAAHGLLTQLFQGEELAALRREIEQLAHELDVPGALNGLVSVTLRHTLPGVPDLYQGCEYWDLSLVDPDNRSPVDYPARMRSLQSNTPLPQQLAQFRDATLKQQLIQTLLTARNNAPELFGQGDYQPWMARGPAARHVLAFTRRHGDSLLLVALPHHCWRWMKDQTLPRVPDEVWRDTSLPLPAGRWRCRNLLDSSAVATRQDDWLVGDLLAEWPVAVWLAQRSDHE